MSEAQTTASEPGAARDLTAFQQNVLVILAEEPRYGLAIKRELEAYYDEEVNHGRLYPNLDDLVEQGLLEKSELDKRTNQYAITGEGLEVLFDQLSWVLERVAADGDRTDRLASLVESTR